MKRTRGGRLIQKVTVCRDKGTQVNDDGQPVETEEELFTLYAEAEPIGGMERVAAQQRTSDVLYRLRVPSDSQTRTIQPNWWLKVLTETDGTQIRLDITRVYDVDLRRRELYLDCTQRVMPQ